MEQLRLCVAGTEVPHGSTYGKLENILLEQGKAIDFLLKLSNLSRYDEVLHD